MGESCFESLITSFSVCVCVMQGMQAIEYFNVHRLNNFQKGEVTEVLLTNIYCDCGKVNGTVTYSPTLSKYTDI